MAARKKSQYLLSFTLELVVTADSELDAEEKSREIVEDLERRAFAHHHPVLEAGFTFNDDARKR